PLPYDNVRVCFNIEFDVFINVGRVTLARARRENRVLDTGRRCAGKETGEILADNLLGRAARTRTDQQRNCRPARNCGERSHGFWQQAMQLAVGSPRPHFGLEQLTPLWLSMKSLMLNAQGR